MAEFRYKAATASGEAVDGQMDGDSREMVVARLQSQGLIPIKVEAAAGKRGGLAKAGGAKSARASRATRVSQKDIGLLTGELATLLKAGLPLDRALTIMIDIGDDEKTTVLLSKVQDAVRGGSSLADALETQQGMFSRMYISMVRAGEAGGALELILSRLADYMERAKALRTTVTNALIYPAILASVAGLSLIFLLTFVVPRFQQMFDDAGRALPWSTQVVVAAGEVLRDGWWMIALAVVGAVWLLRRQLEQPGFRRGWDGWWLNRPVIGPLIQKVEMARLARTLGTLLNNGVPLLSALEIVRETVGNAVLADALGDVAKGVREGNRIADPLAETGLFPALAVQMIKVGEETGQLEGMLDQVADTYDGEVQTAVTRAVALLEPLIIVTLGLLVLGIIVSILWAILSINELAF